MKFNHIQNGSAVFVNADCKPLDAGWFSAQNEVVIKMQPKPNNEFVFKMTIDETEDFIEGLQECLADLKSTIKEKE